MKAAHLEGGEKSQIIVLGLDVPDNRWDDEDTSRDITGVLTPVVLELDPCVQELSRRR